MFDGIGSIGDVNAVRSPNAIQYGMGATAKLEGYVTDEDLESALVVTDEGVLEAGAADPVFDALEAAGVEVTTYDGVQPEPKLHLAEAAADELTRADADVVVGVGGGSSMDTAKLASALAVHDVPVRELLGMGNVPGPGLPTVLVPTTAGTGSEVTHIGVFADGEDDGNKKVVYSEHLYADLALVDPELTRSLPPQVAAATGMDALSHAVEAYTSTLRTPYTDALARRAIELIGENFREAVHQGEHNDEARYGMSLAAMLAGQAFVNSGLGAVHALTYPLGTECGLGHGLANGVLLPHVIRYNVPAEPDRFADIATLLGVPERADESTLERARRSVDAVCDLNDDVGIPNRIRDVEGGDVDRSQFDAFAEIALEHSRHNVDRNPRRMTKDDIVDVFETAY
ncbi:iron-containing alcohol dehydrogenase [Natrialba swarupiae]|uniref:Iron-containing alcohol dehydrogenase n=1 Tax=Natrialba swarupiae TaxID=2448032 RepID=A0A5D5AH62_9EURY|nr:iron-containing alcohol dehydrogenase [Natrialba swarupiae]TYT61066.1 iron-containing alcohol dehydrogenase [Natrialba swarupiae]